MKNKKLITIAIIVIAVLILIPVFSSSGAGKKSEKLYRHNVVVTLTPEEGAGFPEVNFVISTVNKSSAQITSADDLPYYEAEVGGLSGKVFLDLVDVCFYDQFIGIRPVFMFIKDFSLDNPGEETYHPFDAYLFLWDISSLDTSTIDTTAFYPATNIEILDTVTEV